MEIISSFKFLIKLFHATSLFYIPWKYQKIKGFLIFSRVQEMNIGWKWDNPFLTNVPIL